MRHHARLEDTVGLHITILFVRNLLNSFYTFRTRDFNNDASDYFIKHIPTNCSSLKAVSPVLSAVVATWLQSEFYVVHT